MRAIAASALLLSMAACSSSDPIEGVPPPLMGATEMQQRPGLFSGGNGEFVVAGPQNWSEPDAVESPLLAEVDAGP